MGYLARVLVNAPNKEAKAEAIELLEQALTLREQYLDRTLASALSERNTAWRSCNSYVLHPELLAWPGILHVSGAGRARIP